MSLAEVSLYRYRLALSEPLSLSSGTLAYREGALLRVRDEAGAEGWGDAAPLPGYSTETLDRVLEVAQSILPAFDASVLSDELPSLAFARDTALGMLEGDQDEEISLFQVPLNALVDRSSKAGAAHTSYRALKMKVGQDPIQDAERVNDVCRAVSAEVAIRLDANQAWTRAQIKTFAEHIDVERIAYIEEPVVVGESLAAVYRQTGLKLALDERLRGHAASDALLEDGVVALIIKPTMMGSLEKIAAWCEVAEMNGVQAVFSSCFESGVGHWSIARLAQTFSGDCPVGLDTYQALRDDVLNPTLSILNGILEVKAPFSQGYVLNRDRLEEVASWRA